MANLSIVIFRGIEYYNGDQLREVCKTYFQGCASARSIITKKKIPRKFFTFGKKQGKKWIETSGASKKYDKIFLSRVWIEKYAPEFNNDGADIDNESDADVDSYAESDTESDA